LCVTNTCQVLCTSYRNVGVCWISTIGFGILTHRQHHRVVVSAFSFFHGTIPQNCSCLCTTRCVCFSICLIQCVFVFLDTRVFSTTSIIRGHVHKASRSRRRCCRIQTLIEHCQSLRRPSPLQNPWRRLPFVRNWITRS
jgi:hypothetical protein